MADNNRNGAWKNVVLAALVTGFVAFWSGYALSVARDDGLIKDHESRIRVIEQTLSTMAGDIRVIRERVEGYDAKR